MPAVAHSEFGLRSGVVEPLRNFLAELSRYRPGDLRCDQVAAHLPVYGLYHLDDPDGLLRDLEKLLPIQVRQRSR
ncbi:hypothetical protein B1810_07855 [Panacagrimonas perspica]|uniref:hypothetical protein n=1 Tax=Panacagrimonas perspica TaxID=381431 RepID=UPI00105E09AE|nr:hypothetical protein [Panacagrimonas perspica]THD03783.1 hypothetical protein B1810_07855 [Panacagrimonas perspica]